VVISYEEYGKLFPPGEPDMDARERAWTFATENGLLVGDPSWR
jgi:hypothetical protein